MAGEIGAYVVIHVEHVRSTGLSWSAGR